jgi:hypothetical protein
MSAKVKNRLQTPVKSNREALERVVKKMHARFKVIHEDYASLE